VRRSDTAAPTEALDGSESDLSTGVSTDNLLDDTWDDADEAEDSVSSVGVSAGASQATHVRHVERDYSYVGGELVRIAILAAILLIALVIVAILR
jgi:hypothetical protein